MTSENNSLLLNLQEVDKTTGEVVKLDVEQHQYRAASSAHETRSLRPNSEINREEQGEPEKRYRRD